MAAAAVVIPHIERDISHQQIAPKYLVYTDRFTAKVLDQWKRPSSLQLAPTTAAIVCPWSEAKGLHGYSVTIHVDSLESDRAVLSYTVKCARSWRGGFETGESVAAERIGQQWSLAKVLDRWVT